jgi:hypothetical protein
MQNALLASDRNQYAPLFISNNVPQNNAAANKKLTARTLIFFEGLYKFYFLVEIKQCCSMISKGFSRYFLSAILGSFLMIVSTEQATPMDDHLSLNQGNFLQLEMVPVGDPGNQPDPKTGKGSVDEALEIGKFEITASQYCAFLNAVAARDPYQLYSLSMQYDSAVRCIERYGCEGLYSYQVIPGREMLPVSCIDWYSAARFCNWLENGQPLGEEGPATTEQGTYLLNGMIRNIKDGDDNLSHKNLFINSVIENPDAHWHLPTESQ